jgi:hypothetical protein
MKKLLGALGIVALLFSSSASFAQIRKIPAEVTDAFKAKYPDASAVEWKDKLSTFQADFKMKNEAYQARFNSKGEWQDSEKNIDQEKLPSAVKDGFSKSKYADWEVREVSYLEKKGDVTQYRILVKKSDLEKKYLFFNKSGKLLKDTITL